MDGRIDITWLGHSTVVIDLDRVRVLTDPLLRANAGPLRRLGARPDPALWQDPDAVLISHLHYDHAELGSLRLLGRTPILTDERNVAWLRKRRLPSAVPVFTDRWVNLGGEVEALQVRADHHSRPLPHRPNATHGHLVRGPSGRVWVAGDTSLYAEMAALPELAGGPIDVAFVPIWGWGPRLSAGHMDPEDAALAVAACGARFAVPVHWGTLHPPFMTAFTRSWLHRPGRQFAEAVARHASACVPVLLEPGESRSLLV